MHDIICALCGKNQQKRLLYKASFTQKDISATIFSARRIPDKIHYQLYTCTNCGLIFSSPIFSNKKITSLYTQSFLSYPDQVRFVTKTYMDLFEKIKTLLPKNPRILEIGCGDGFFLQALQKNNYKNVFGVEPSKPMIHAMPKPLQKNIKQSPFKKGLFPTNTFDTICCFHTLDHVTDPQMVVKETYALLKKGGIALFVLHDTGALSVKLFGEKSPIFDIEHIYLFNKATITKIFKKNGFTNITVSDLTNTYPLTYWIQMAAIPKQIKTFFLHLLIQTKLGAIPISLKGGNMYITAQKR